MEVRFEREIDVSRARVGKRGAFHVITSAHWAWALAVLALPVILIESSFRLLVLTVTYVAGLVTLIAWNLVTPWRLRRRLRRKGVITGRTYFIVNDGGIEIGVEPLWRAGYRWEVLLRMRKRRTIVEFIIAGGSIFIDVRDLSAPELAELDRLLRIHLGDGVDGCPQCGYDLRATTGLTCPECGMQVRQTATARNDSAA